MKKLGAVVLAATLFTSLAAHADIYMQSPRGSNNRICDGGCNTTTSSSGSGTGSALAILAWMGWF